MADFPYRHQRTVNHGGRPNLTCHHPRKPRISSTRLLNIPFHLERLPTVILDRRLLWPCPIRPLVKHNGKKDMYFCFKCVLKPPYNTCYFDKCVGWDARLPSYTDSHPKRLHINPMSCYHNGQTNRNNSGLLWQISSKTTLSKPSSS